MADKEKKEKKSNPLFDLINALFTSREYVYGITAETAKQNLFMVLRRLAIKYPVEANVFNDSKVNPIDVIRFFSDYLYCGVAPKWIYTSVKSKKTSDNDITTGTKLRWVMFIIFGNGPFNNDDVRRFAKSCTSIVEEIDTPSIEDLIRANKITSAVYLYYKMQNGSVTMSEAKDYVLELEKSMKN